MTKARYRYYRYLFYIPISIGEKLDTTIDYDVRIVDKLIILIPKHLRDLASIAKLENVAEKNMPHGIGSSEDSISDGMNDDDLD